MDGAKKLGLPQQIIILTAAMCLILDQASKHYVKHSLAISHTITVIPGILRFTLTSNAGAAFSLGNQHSQLVAVLATIMTGALIYWIMNLNKTTKTHMSLEYVGIGFLLGGALGNLIDRFSQGRVTDFLDLAFISFPIFNIADICIDIGIFFILYARLWMRAQS